MNLDIHATNYWSEPNKKNTCTLSGDWAILERRFAFSWTFCTNVNSALEIWATKKENRISINIIYAPSSQTFRRNGGWSKQTKGGTSTPNWKQCLNSQITM